MIRTPESAPHARQQLAAVAELRWRIFANSLRTFRGRLELASRIFIGLAFVAGGIGGAVGLGGAAWFVISQKNPEWLGGLLWPVFLFWQLFPLMATAFTQNVESSNLLRFPLSYRSYFLIRLAYGSLDPATAVASLWLLGIDIGIGVARPSLLPWATIVLLTFALVNLVLARMLFAWLERWLAQRRTREIMGILFFLFVLSFQLDRSVDRSLRTSIHTRNQNSGAGTLQRAAPAAAGPGCRRDRGSGAEAAWVQCRHGQRGALPAPGVLWNCIPLAVEFSFAGGVSRREPRRVGGTQSLVRRASSDPPGLEFAGTSRTGGRCLRKRVALSQSQRADAFHSDRAPVHAGGVSKFRKKRRPVCARAGAYLSAGRRLLAALADQSFLQQFWS